MVKTNSKSVYYHLRVGLAQMNSVLGDFPENRDKIIQFIKKAEENRCDIVLFPEMAITGYPVQDLVYKQDFVENNLKIIDQLKPYVRNVIAVIGCITKVEKSKNKTTAPFYNSAAVLYPNGTTKYIHKHLLPNYDVFDEKRYFNEYKHFPLIKFEQLRIGLEICEDLWDKQYSVKVSKELKKRGANAIFIINASPYYIEKPKIREGLVKLDAKKYKIPFVYLNTVGGQDEIVYDGRSFVVDDSGRTIHRLKAFEEDFICFSLPIPVKEKFERTSLELIKNPKDLYKTDYLRIDTNEEIFKALVLNLRDYYYKTGIFKKIVLGLSGGIDSSFTAVIACHAVGPENVVGILMPSKFSSDHSVADAIQLCKNLGMEYIEVPIKKIHNVLDEEVREHYQVEEFSVADENLQSRIRGVLLMYYSNKFDALLVSTGNKSEIAVGYCTLYGDTNGGKNVPGDLYKVQIYEVADWINKNIKPTKSSNSKQLIPQNCIDKPPSAELKPNQTDQDSLPPYKILDAILYEMIENQKSIRSIIKMGYDAELVKRIEKLYHASEYKRAQLAQTIKITKKSFGLGYRFPIINRYHTTRQNI
ncbi:MAG: NAD+ synthase [Promethearchaeota archaeon]|nr:MAG: NAD+ synthase [Candidatus Lokiarchaeota archaeon]